MVRIKDFLVFPPDLKTLWDKHGLEGRWSLSPSHRDSTRVEAVRLRDFMEDYMSSKEDSYNG